MSTTPQPDPFQQAHADANKAVATFLPSLLPQPPAPEPTTPPPPPALAEPVRAISLARHIEQMSARVARGLPAVASQPTPEQTFGPELDPVHIRALSEAIALHPETERAALLHQAHEGLVRWIAAHNGRVVVDGKLLLAHSPESAEQLAAKIINGAVDDHDQRQAVASMPSLQVSPGQDAPSRSAPMPVRSDQAPPAAAAGIASSLPARTPLPVAVSPDANTPEITPPGGDGTIEEKGPVPQEVRTRPSKGQIVTLQDGSQGEIVFVHPNMNFMRVRTDSGVVTAPIPHAAAQ